MQDRYKPIYTKELAALIASGLSLEQAANKADLAPEEARQLTSTPEFEALLAEKGPQVLAAWLATQADAKAQESARKQARDKLHEYVEMLDEMARNEKVRDDIRVNCIKELVRLAGAGDDRDTVHEIVELPQAFIDNWVEAYAEVHGKRKAKGSKTGL